jgi:acyl carrier protein
MYLSGVIQVFKNPSQVDIMETRQQVRDFITSNFYVPAPTSFDDKMSLLERGIVDSTGILEVIEFLRGAFGIAVEESELLPENFDSIEAIVAYVSRKVN